MTELTTHTEPHHVTIYFASHHCTADYQHADQLRYRDVQLPPGSYVRCDDAVLTLRMYRTLWLARAFRQITLFEPEELLT